MDALIGHRIGTVRQLVVGGSGALLFAPWVAFRHAHTLGAFPAGDRHEHTAATKE